MRERPRVRRNESAHYVFLKLYVFVKNFLSALMSDRWTK